MAAALLRALMLTAFLAAAAPVCQAEAAGDARQAGEAVAETEAVDGGSIYQALSTLGALSLGILGLLWVRRHTAEL